jgi:hypothetical protein
MIALLLAPSELMPRSQRRETEGESGKWTSGREFGLFLFTTISCGHVHVLAGIPSSHRVSLLLDT